MGSMSKDPGPQFKMHFDSTDPVDGDPDWVIKRKAEQAAREGTARIAPASNEAPRVRGADPNALANVAARAAASDLQTGRRRMRIPLAPALNATSGISIPS